jgi:hypothetical protein
MVCVSFKDKKGCDGPVLIFLEWNEHMSLFGRGSSNKDAPDLCLVGGMRRDYCMDGNFWPVYHH